VILLLDEMWPLVIAEQMRARGHDVVAAAARTDLRTKSDGDVFRVAQLEGRAIVTENAADYLLIARQENHRGRSHAGLILTTDRRFPRHDRRTAGRLVSALETLLTRTTDATNQEIWLR
jgi:hypothetical protein